MYFKYNTRCSVSLIQSPLPSIQTVRSNSYPNGTALKHHTYYSNIHHQIEAMQMMWLTHSSNHCYSICFNAVMNAALIKLQSDYWAHVHIYWKILVHNRYLCTYDVWEFLQIVFLCMPFTHNFSAILPVNLQSRWQAISPSIDTIKQGKNPDIGLGAIAKNGFKSLFIKRVFLQARPSPLEKKKPRINP